MKQQNRFYKIVHIEDSKVYIEYVYFRPKNTQLETTLNDIRTNAKKIEENFNELFNFKSNFPSI